MVGSGIIIKIGRKNALPNNPGHIVVLSGGELFVENVQKQC
jgi:hypothetical protein